MQQEAKCLYFNNIVNGAQIFKKYPHGSVIQEYRKGNRKQKNPIQSMGNCLYVLFLKRYKIKTFEHNLH